MISADIGVSTPLELMLFDGATSKAVRVRIRTTTGDLIHTANLTHIGEGLYTGSWVPSSIGYYHAVYTAFTDSSYTTEDFTYSRTTETYRVTLPGALDPAVFAQSVWNAALTDYNIAGTFGAEVGSIESKYADIVSKLTNITVKIIGIKAKTDLIPPDPATITAIVASTAEIIAAFNNSLLALENIILGIKERTDNLPSDPASITAITYAQSVILEAISNLGETTAEQIWTYVSRTLTTPPSEFGPDISNLATKTDILAIGSVHQYINRMTTTFNPASGSQEVLVWAEKDGQQMLSVEDCTIFVKNAQGITKWTQSSSTANADGIFRFINPIVVSEDANYYIIMAIKVEGSFKVTQQAFITIG